eukprot:3418867-Ditylum_brightwellii.AAC.1
MVNINKAISKAIFGFLLLVQANIAQFPDDPDKDQCAFSEESDDREFYFNIDLDIEELGITDLEDEAQRLRLEFALRDYYNAAIDCACPGNLIRYTAVAIGEPPMVEVTP